MSDNKQLENESNQADTKDTNLNNDEYTKLSSESIKTLEDAIKNIHAEIDFASRSFSADAESSSTSLRSTIDSLNKSLKGSDSNLTKYDKIANTLDSQTRTLALLPKKVEERLEVLPNNIKNAIIDNIPDIGDKLAQEQKNLAKEVQASMNEYADRLKTKVNETSIQFKEAALELKHSTNSYKRELEALIEISSKKRTRRLFITLLVAGGFSALVSGFTSWYINSKFPHSVELHDNGSVTVQNSKVLVVDPDSPYNKGKKP